MLKIKWLKCELIVFGMLTKRLLITRLLLIEPLMKLDRTTYGLKQLERKRSAYLFCFWDVRQVKKAPFIIFKGKLSIISSSVEYNSAKNHGFGTRAWKDVKNIRDRHMLKIFAIKMDGLLSN
jgi:hypothetical protein